MTEALSDSFEFIGAIEISLSIYPCHGPLSVRVGVSHKSLLYIETDKRIELAFDIWASFDLSYTVCCKEVRVGPTFTNFAPNSVL